MTPLCRIISVCFFRSVKHKKLLLADYRFPCDLPCVGYPLLGNPTKNAFSRSGPRTCPRSTDHGGRGSRCRAGHESCAGELASTVNTARSARRRAVSAQVRPWFLTARRRLKSLLPLGRSRDSACDSLAMNGVTRRRLNPGADARGRPAGQKAALWVRRRR